MRTIFDYHLAMEIAAGSNKGRIVTRAGESVRLLCFDAKSVYPVVGLVESDGKERPCSWTADGRMDYHPGAQRQSDLFIEVEPPVIETREDAIESLLRDHADGANLRDVLKTAMDFADSHPKVSDAKGDD